jgi:hypothetical protein
MIGKAALGRLDLGAGGICDKQTVRDTQRTL